MRTSTKTLVDLETRFWQSMVDQDAETAVSLLSEPAYMVSSHGAIKFDHAGFRRMTEQAPKVLSAFEFIDLEVAFPNDVTAVLTYRVRQRVASRGKAAGEQQEMADTSTWVQTEDGDWKCVMHTETPIDPSASRQH